MYSYINLCEHHKVMFHMYLYVFICNSMHPKYLANFSNFIFQCSIQKIFEQTHSPLIMANDIIPRDDQQELEEILENENIHRRSTVSLRRSAKLITIGSLVGAAMGSLYPEGITEGLYMGAVLSTVIETLRHSTAKSLEITFPSWYHRYDSQRVKTNLTMYRDGTSKGIGTLIGVGGMALFYTIGGYLLSMPHILLPAITGAVNGYLDKHFERLDGENIHKKIMESQQQIQYFGDESE
jgi:hypothetical protein